MSRLLYRFVVSKHRLGLSPNLIDIVIPMQVWSESYDVRKG